MYVSGEAAVDVLTSLSTVLRHSPNINLMIDSKLFRLHLTRHKLDDTLINTTMELK
jgi:hypothetical protein